MNTFDRIANIVANQLSVDPSKITKETTFEEVDADSLDVVEVIMSIEGAFDIKLPDEEVEQFKNVGEMAAFVDRLLA